MQTLKSIYLYTLTSHFDIFRVSSHWFTILRVCYWSGLPIHCSVYHQFLLLLLWQHSVSQSSITLLPVEIYHQGLLVCRFLAIGHFWVTKPVTRSWKYWGRSMEISTALLRLDICTFLWGASKPYVKLMLLNQTALWEGLKITIC